MNTSMNFLKALLGNIGAFSEFGLRPINFYIPITQFKYRKLYYKNLYLVISWMTSGFSLKS